MKLTSEQRWYDLFSYCFLGPHPRICQSPQEYFPWSHPGQAQTATEAHCLQSRFSGCPNPSFQPQSSTVAWEQPPSFLLASLTPQLIQTLLPSRLKTSLSSLSATPQLFSCTSDGFAGDGAFSKITHSTRTSQTAALALDSMDHLSYHTAVLITA